jgi:hypothetical protein
MESKLTPANLRAQADCPMRPLLFVTRHEPAPEQYEMVKSLGYEGIERRALTFSKDPVKDLRAIGIYPPHEVAVVAPAHIILQLLIAGYTVIEFENSAVSRANNTFQCTGLYRMKLDHITYYPAPRPEGTLGT